MHTLYALQVFRAERGSPGASASAAPHAENLYVRVKMGEDQPKTKLQDGAAPISLYLSPDTGSKGETLLIELKQRLYLTRSRCLGSVKANLSDLMSESANGEVRLSLHPSEKSGPLTLGELYVRLSATDAESEVGKEIRSAIQGAQQSGIGKPTTADPFEAIDKGIALAASWADLAKSLEKILDRVDLVVAIIDKVSSIHPYLSIAWQAISCLYKVARKQQEADKWFAHLVYMMEFILDVIYGLESDRSKVKTLEGTICQFMQQSAECCVFIQHYIRHGFIGRALDQTSLQKTKDFTERFRDFRDALSSGLALQTSFVLSRVAEKVDIMFLQGKLNPPDTNAPSLKACLLGTRTEILEEIMGWFLSDSDENILWLRGAAGSGKSTIGMTIAGRCQELCRRGAYLCFQREKSDPSSVIRALAVSLASFNPSIEKHVSDAVRNHHEITRDTLAFQFTKLIYNPLLAAAESIQGPVIIILDALDECGTSEARKDLLSLIESEFGNYLVHSAFSSRVVRRRTSNQKLSSQSARVRVIDLDVSSTSSHEDVSLYIRSEMRSIFEEEDIKSMPDWDQSMAVLGSAANGLFIWASTAIKMVSTGDDPFEDLENLVSYCQPTDGGLHHVELGLKSLYDTVLRNSGIRWDNDRSRSRFTQVLGLILLSKVPLSISAIDGILGFPKRSSSRLIIERLQSVLVYIPGNSDAPVRIFHASFSDYLTDLEHSKYPWYVDVAKQHRFIATQCFKVMREGLRFNICDVESSYLRNEDVAGIQERIRERIPPSLDYACCFWAAHLCGVASDDASQELISNLETFAQQSLLHWMEVLSLMKRSRHVYNRALTDATSWSAKNASDVSSLLRDAHQFATTFSIPISASVPHIYLSALSFQENTSTMRKHYSTRHPIAHIRTFGSKVPQSYIKIFEGHRSRVYSVAFSPDGKRIVSGSGDKTIRVWDAESGELVAGPFEGHAGYVLSVAFSPDGKRVVSGSGDMTIRVWDANYEPTSVQSPCDVLSSCDSVRYFSDSMRVLLASLGISASWITSHDGWLLGRNGELLLWVPPDVRPTLWQPSNVAIFSCRFFTVLDLTNCRAGPGWHKGFPRP